VPGYRLADFLHGYCYGRWPYLYIALATGEHPLARKLRPILDRLEGVMLRKRRQEASCAMRFADTYHGKVVPLDAARSIVSVGQPIRLSAPEQVIPYARARDIVLENPDHIVAMECPCRASRAHPCAPLDVCLIVGEPFAGFIAEHHPSRARWITQAEAEKILREEEERGHVHHAFFKDAMLDRFYAICNCCSCCCGAMQAQRNGAGMLASSGYVSESDPDLCTGCGTCTEFCQFDAAAVVDGKNHVDRERCMGCGVCISHCPHDALRLVRAEEKGMPLEIMALVTASGAAPRGPVAAKAN
jgi:Pyruvate/2-oxoacid:ferredoxin oxidoreductase delta subunit